MWILKIHETREVLPGINTSKENYRQYFIEEDADKAQKLADELNANYKRLGCDGVFIAEAHKCED